MWVHVVCVCVEGGGGRGEGGGGSIVAQFYLREIVFEKNWYTSVAHVSFDEIHRTVIT